MSFSLQAGPRGSFVYLGAVLLHSVSARSDGYNFDKGDSDGDWGKHDEDSWKDDWEDPDPSSSDKWWSPSSTDWAGSDWSSPTPTRSSKTRSASTTSWSSASTPHGSHQSETSPPASVTLSTITSVTAAPADSSPSTSPHRISPVAIAVPLAICGLIGFVALLFCAKRRNKPSPASDLERSAIRQIPPPLPPPLPPVQQVEATTMRPTPGVTVTQREESVSRPPIEEAILPSLSYHSGFDRQDSMLDRYLPDRNRERELHMEELYRSRTSTCSCHRISRSSRSDYHLPPPVSCSSHRGEPGDYHPTAIESRSLRTSRRFEHDSSSTLSYPTSRSDTCMTPTWSHRDHYTSMPSRSADLRSLRRDDSRYLDRERKSRSSAACSCSDCIPDHHHHRYALMPSRKHSHMSRWSGTEEGSILNPHPKDHRRDYSPESHRPATYRPFMTSTDGRGPRYFSRSQEADLARDYSMSSMDTAPNHTTDDLYESLKAALSAQR